MIEEDLKTEGNLRPQLLVDYIGQEKAKENLKVYIEAAKQRNDALDHVLFYGPPGLGKTTLAGIIANEMGVHLKVTSGPAIEKPGEMAAILNNLQEHDVLFVDEIHRLNRQVEEVLYPAMEDYAIDIMIGKGTSARSIRLELPKFTLVGATTRAGMLTAPLRDRFGVVHHLEYYTENELKTIIIRSAKVLGVEIAAETLPVLTSILFVATIPVPEELEEMGMFAPEYKQPIPSFVQTVGVVTAPTGAVIQDIRNVTARRNPYVQIILYPAQVQGEGAAESIVEGIEALDQLGVDVIIVGRGGGSMEDLWAFNEEIVARAIFHCSTPIISAVGHETDVTIADYVADLRAPTPSAAAELAVFDYRGWQELLAGYVRRLELSMDSKLEMTRQRLTEKAARLAYLSPENQIQEKRMYLLRAEEKLTERMEKKLQMEKTRLYLYAERLRGVSPLEKLQQGLGYMEHEDGSRMSSVGQVREGERMKTYVKDGVIWSNVEKTENSDAWNVSRGKETDNCE